MPQRWATAPLLPASAFRPAVGVRALCHDYELKYSRPRRRRDAGCPAADISSAGRRTHRGASGQSRPFVRLRRDAPRGGDESPRLPPGVGACAPWLASPVSARLPRLMQLTSCDGHLPASLGARTSGLVQSESERGARSGVRSANTARKTNPPESTACTTDSGVRTWFSNSPSDLNPSGLGSG
jgi:hypothetical protein